MNETKRRIIENPFVVLELPNTADRAAIERKAQTLLSELELGFEGAEVYVTPFGSATRDASMVRAAAATLRDPDARAIAALWAPFGDVPESEAHIAQVPPFPDALAAVGWRPSK